MKENNKKLNDINAFTFFFYRFLLAEDVISFDNFYDLVGSYISFKNDRICLSLPEDVDIVVTHKSLTDRAIAVRPNAIHYSVENFLEGEHYEES